MLRSRLKPSSGIASDDTERSYEMTHDTVVPTAEERETMAIDELIPAAARQQVCRPGSKIRSWFRPAARGRDSGLATFRVVMP